MNEQIQSKLALSIAQYALDKATLEVQVSQLNEELTLAYQRNQELEALLDQATSPSTETKEDEHGI